MSLNRENIYASLFGLIQTVPGVSNISRKLTHWGDCPQFPALYLHQKGESVRKSGRRLPSIHTMSCEVYVYVRVGDGDLSASALNALTDLVSAAIAPAHPSVLNQQTLGGQVEDCWIDGEIVTDEGTLGNIGVAIIPISILVGE